MGVSVVRYEGIKLADGVSANAQQWIRAEDLPRVLERGVTLKPAAKGAARLREKFSQPLFVLMIAVSLVFLIASCTPGQWNTGCRHYCLSPGGYFFGNYAFFDEYWFGQYPYSYAAAYQPQLAPDSYYQGMGQQWGKDLKDGTVPQERLVALIQVQMLNIPQHSQNAFRRVFWPGMAQAGNRLNHHAGKGRQRT